jgi:hypothetical protein
MKRIKKVFGNSKQVIHLWANQSQEEARSGNCYFKGTKIWSYGSHYLLGEIVSYKGKKVAVINRNESSQTTNRQRWIAFWAVSHLNKIQSSDGTVKTGLIEEQELLINELMSQFGKIKPHYNKYHVENVEEFNKLCLELGHKELVLSVDGELQEILKEHLKYRNGRNEVLLGQREEKRIAKQKAQELVYQQALKDWENGGPLNRYFRHILGGLDRIRVKGNIVETTGGAEVPLSHALRLLAKIKAKQEKQGDKVGGFTLTSVEDGIVQIGCHKILLSHAEEVLSDKGLKLVE